MNTKYLIFLTLLFISSCSKPTTNAALLFRESPAWDNEPKGTQKGSRIFKDIVQTVIDSGYMGDLKYKYNEQMRLTGGQDGWIFTKLIIDSKGNVIKSSITKSTLEMHALEEYIISNSANWKFNVIKDSTDTTIAIIPFVFSR